MIYERPLFELRRKNMKTEMKIKPKKIIFRAASVAYITGMINHDFISFSAVQIYDLLYIYLHSHD